MSYDFMGSLKPHVLQCEGTHISKNIERIFRNLDSKRMGAHSFLVVVFLQSGFQPCSFCVAQI